METPWQRAKKTRSQLQEEGLGKRGRQQINSGRTAWTSKRDAQIYNRLLVEARTTERGSISISYREWKDIRRQAVQTPPGLLPAMHLEIQDVRLLVLDDRDANEFFTRMEFLEGRVKELEGPQTKSDDQLS
jgi:hypothetical protein